MITLLNTSILTTCGQFDYSPADLTEVRRLLSENNDEFVSAIGHESTAQILSDLLGLPVAVNRIQYAQQVGDIAVIFKLRGRAPEGVILSREEVERIGYDFGIITKKA